MKMKELCLFSVKIVVKSFVFIFSMIFMIIYGLFKYFILNIHPQPMYTVLAIFYTAVPITNRPTVVSQIAFGVFNKGIMYYVVQFSTAIILLMACNTAFTGFPMLMYVVGKDGYAPRQFTIRGKRLSFSVGIMALSFIACILVIVFRADTHRLIPLYAIGVFISFTLGQFGMVNHWRRGREVNWKRGVAINGIGYFINNYNNFNRKIH